MSCVCLTGQIETLGSSKSVRLRIAPQNSLLQRFQPDSAITTPVVLSLDDDIYMTCRDLQKGFDAFQASPAQLVGYHPRLVEGQPLLYRSLLPSWQLQHPKGSSKTYGRGSQAACTCCAQALGAQLAKFNAVHHKGSGEVIQQAQNMVLFQILQAES